MAAAPDQPTGPLQQGRGAHGQYVYWACQAHPSDGNLTKKYLQLHANVWAYGANLGLRTKKGVASHRSASTRNGLRAHETTRLVEGGLS